MFVMPMQPTMMVISGIDGNGDGNGGTAAGCGVMMMGKKRKLFMPSQP